MPVVHVRGISDLTKGEIDAGLRYIAAGVAAALGRDVGDVWCTFSGLETMTVGDDVPRDDDRILYLELLLRLLPEAATALEAAANQAATAFGVRPENVWARLTPLEPGTVFAGGEPV